MEEKQVVQYEPVLGNVDVGSIYLLVRIDNLQSNILGSPQRVKRMKCSIKYGSLPLLEIHERICLEIVFMSPY